ncbi:4'-phosphopantetheinyl transferase superfamily protein [Streptomyces sp. NBC_01485]|uniref:4'-phosphopantetheinyl transferase superfamily protein n=1 Tax=Streptomyces sp. NBC_01485 TaxID=2903884 RepID=UPI002E3146A2|nr:4'-phosphopantetheinyl transferase superfamily protein [Streptomyces sp. NBC_01485]
MSDRSPQADAQEPPILPTGPRVDPYEMYAKMRADGVVQLIREPNGLHRQIVLRYEEAKAVMADPRFAKDPGLAWDQLREAGYVKGERDNREACLQHLVNTDPPDHTRLRRLISKAFTKRRMEETRPRTQEIAAELLDRMDPSGTVDLVEDYAHPLATTVICEILGVPDNDRGPGRRLRAAAPLPRGLTRLLARRAAPAPHPHHAGPCRTARPPGTAQAVGDRGRVDRRPRMSRTRQAHVWTCRVPRSPEGGDDQAARWLPLLSVSERDRMDRFRHAADRDLYATAHGLLRTALSRAAPGVDPTEWQFRTGPQGRPELAGEAAGTGLRFNLSHTAGLAACVVTRGPDCGIDVEALGRRSADHRSVRTVLAPSEAAALLALPEPSRAAGFLRYWTLKEAYAKAIGLGLSVPFDQCCFSFTGAPGSSGPGADTGAISLSHDHAGRWQFRQWLPGPEHLLALALRRGAGADLTVVGHGVDAGLPSDPRRSLSPPARAARPVSPSPGNGQDVVR